MQTIFVTGGAGFIGSAIVRKLITEHHVRVVNVDKLTYAADLTRLSSVEKNKDYIFENADICDSIAIGEIFEKHQPAAVIHAAAETHVDRSIDSASAFIHTNINGTYTLLESTRKYLLKHSESERQTFRFLQVSTDEVYGDRKDKAPASEETPYQPSSPYAASKASADHLVQSWARTYGIPTLITHSSNNYGPGQNEEKLIPHLIAKALASEPLPIYGTGEQTRDWLHVDDNAAAILTVLVEGTVNQSYNIASNNELTNMQIADQLCNILDQIVEAKPFGIKSFKEQITHVADRPGHDHRYALDTTKMKTLGWKPQANFEKSLSEIIQQKISQSTS